MSTKLNLLFVRHGEDNANDFSDAYQRSLKSDLVAGEKDSGRTGRFLLENKKNGNIPNLNFLIAFGEQKPRIKSTRNKIEQELRDSYSGLPLVDIDTSSIPSPYDMGMLAARMGDDRYDQEDVVTKMKARVNSIRGDIIEKINTDIISRYTTEDNTVSCVVVADGIEIGYVANDFASSPEEKAKIKPDLGFCSITIVSITDKDEKKLIEYDFNGNSFDSKTIESMRDLNNTILA
ncbi:hypothetical protein [Methanosarcina sp.]|uniref:hypothetical protein n=1 Tax=Methanosarcina sp. TaxID=2213 RepID=UPI002ABC595B|nr:hypothetical protein [Methanosarcina sp.]MDY9927376.1 hypothetical protein [Methanosarcina sp.]